MARDPVCGMQVSEESAIKITRDNEVFYFCSDHCRKSFEGGHPSSKSAGGSCHVQAKATLWKNRLFQTGVGLLVLIGASYVLPVLTPFRETFVLYLNKIWFSIVLGLFIGGLIDYFVPQSYIIKMLAQKRKRTVLSAVMLGFLMSVCSHGILALAVQLHKKGAATAAVVAFLLASPWANLPLTLMMIGFFGVSRALFLIFGAIGIAIITGLIYQSLESRRWVEENPISPVVAPGFSIRQDIIKRYEASRHSGVPLVIHVRGVGKGIVSLANMVLWWILVGMALASLAGAYIPSHLFHEYMGPNFFGMIVTLTLATVLEVCSEGTAPLAFEIFRQTGALGNSFVFLMAGVATDYTEIGLLWQNVGKRTAIFLPLVTVPQILLLGVLANMLF